MQLYLFLPFITGCRTDDSLKAFNNEPVASITSHVDGDTLLEGYAVTFRGYASDANHKADELVVSWYVGEQEICPPTPPDSEGYSECVRSVTMSDSNIIMQVNDPKNASGIATVTLVVQETEAPNASISTPLVDSIYYADQDIHFTGTVYDNEDPATALSVSWESSLDGELSALGSTPANDGSLDAYGQLSAGQHVLSLTVTDSTGKTGQASQSIDVRPTNTAPECAILTPPDGTVGLAGELVEFTATVSDIDIAANQLNIEWSSDKDGLLGTSTASSDGQVLFSYADLSTDTHTISLEVKDEMGLSCSQFISYTVGSPPSVQLDTPIDGSLSNEGEEVIFQATVSDAEDAADAIGLSWELNGNPYGTQPATTTGTAQFVDASLPAGTHTLSITATDSHGLTDNDLITFTINGLPTAPNVSISPSPAYTDNDLEATANGATDPENDPISYSFAWLRDGTTTGLTGSTLPASETTKGEVWTVVVTPNDGNGDGATGQASLTIENTAPVINSVTITPNTSITTSSLLTCSASTLDADDGQPATTFSWSDSNNQILGTGSTLQLDNSLVSPNQTVTCTVTATDSDGAAASASTSVNVENSLPSVDAISLSPSVIYTNHVITASASLSDPDNQTVTATYEWHVIQNNVDTVVQTGSVTTLDGSSFFNRDDQVYVVVTPNDGLDDGPSSTSSNITVSNSAPTAPSIVITPDPATLQQDDLLCSISSPATDDDNDTITYSYQWTDPDGIVQQNTNQTTDLQDIFLASGTTEGDWTCQVTASDGTLFSSTASAVTTVEESIPSDPFLWLDASVGTSCSTEGCAVSSWADQSANMFTVAQNNSSRQPTYRTAGLNGQPAIEFYGGFLEIPSISMFTSSSSALSVFVVFETQNTSSQRFLLNYGPSSCHCSCTFELGYTTGNNGNGNFGLHRGCGNAIVANNGTITTSTPLLMTTILQSSGSSPNNMLLYKNGASISVSNDRSGWNSAGSYSTASSPMQIGIRNDYQTGNIESQHNGTIAEILIYQRHLTDVEREQAECYLSNKYGLQISHCN